MEEQVQEVMRGLPDSDIAVELRECDVEEDKLIEEFMKVGCGCRMECWRQFTEEHIKIVRRGYLELTRDALDVAVKSELWSTTNTSTEVVDSRHGPQERKRGYSVHHYHAGRAICETTFMFLHGIGETRLKNLRKSLKESGIAPRIHGNTKCRPHHALSFNSVEYVVTFLLNYSVEHGLLLPGRVPGYSRSDIKLLPSSTSKRRIWKVYQQACQQDPSIHSVAYSTFCRLWRTLLPSLVLMKPMTDLCWTCQKNSTTIMRAANKSRADKTALIKKANEHLRIVHVERSYYKTTCDSCKREVVEHFTADDKFQPPPLAACSPANSLPLKVHYSFDYAQQVHYPSDPMQPGPIYFLTPRKCSVFGVCCEAIPRQVNFLGDEAGDCGKGANIVISQLHYFFSHHGLGEKEVYLHADNCTGQNKNNTMLHYLAWRCITGKHTQITLSFLVVGHTKFSPDWCFGLFKRAYRRTAVGSLKGIAQVVNESAQCNTVQLVTTDDGTTVVPMLDWADFFAPHLKKISGIKKLHHFRFNSSHPGKVFVKT